MSAYIHAIAFVADRSGYASDGFVLLDDNGVDVAAMQQLPCGSQTGWACTYDDRTFFILGFFH